MQQGWAWVSEGDYEILKGVLRERNSDRNGIKIVFVLFLQ